jgi:group I intron endonuclease
MLIYKITCNINGKIYIGQTIGSLEKRWKRHTWVCTKRKNTMAITNAIVKYGEENFTIERIDVASTIDELNDKEIYYISHYNSLSPVGYNLSPGGGNFRISEESRKKISKANKGRKASPETIQKMRDSHIGYVVKDETKIKLSAINKLKTIDKKVREAASLKNSKCYIIEKDNILYSIRNMKRFAIDNGHDKSGLCKLVNGKKDMFKKFKLVSNMGFVDIDHLVMETERIKDEFGYMEIKYYL